MKITSITTMVLAAAFSVVSCNKAETTTPETTTPAVEEKTETPAPPVKTEEPAAPVKEEPAAEPVAAEPVAAASTPEQIAAQEAVFKKSLPLMETLFGALEGSTDVDDAVKNLGALEPQFIAVSKEMKEAGTPDEATAAKFNTELEPLKAGYTERAQAAVMKLMNVDPSKLDPSDTAAMQKLQADSMKLQGAMEGLMGTWENVWPNVGQ